MASFNRELQGVRYPGMNFDFPSTDKSAANLIDTLGNVGREAYLGHVQKGMVGEEREYTQDELVSAALNEKELNLRKVKQMREQGLISDTGAKVLANRSVQAATARLPGRAAEFRKMTAAFFGDFGEGMGLLEATAAEKKQGEIEFALRKQAAMKGYGSLDPQTGKLIQTSQDVNDFLTIVRKGFHNDQELQQLQLDFENGKATAATAVDFAGRHVRKSLMEFMGDLNGKLAQDGVLWKPEELEARIASNQQVAEAEVNKFLDDPRNKGIVTVQMRTAARQEIADRYNNIKGFVKSQAFSTIMQNRRQGVQDLFKIYSYNALPMMAIAHEAGGEQGVKFFTEYAPKFAKMNANQRNSLLANDPTARAAWNTMIAADRIHRSYGNVIQGFLPAGGIDRVVTQDAAAWQTSQPVENPQDQEAKSKALEILQKSAAEGERDKLAVLTFPETAKNATPQDQEAVLNMMSGEWAAHRVHTAQLMAPTVDSVSGQSIKAKQRVLYDPARQEYVLAWTPKGASASLKTPNRTVGGEKVAAIDITSNALLGTPGVSGQLVESVRNMNRALRIMRNFSGTAKFRQELAGQSIDQFAMKQLEEVNALRLTQEEALDAPLGEQEVDDLLIDVRLGGGRERAARRILQSKGIDVDKALKANESNEND